MRLTIACTLTPSGHPGGAIGMAVFGVALWKYTMRYAPHSPYWFNRDRFILSNGHTCLFQYANLYLSGYKAMTWEQLLSYHSERLDSLCPGHPKIEHEGIELTTGPLGQGIANAVGLAIATKHLAATFNRPGFEVVNNQTWCSIGDVYLQDSNNLTVIYDNNQITCDGSVDLTNTEDVNKKMGACGWEVIDVIDGVNDVEGIVAALEKGRDPKRTKPLFINVRSIIGVGSAVAGQVVSHGAPLGKDNVAAIKKAHGWDTEKVFHIPDKVKKFYGDIPARGEKHVREWNDLLPRYTEEHPDLSATFKHRMAGKLPSNWASLIPSSFPSDPTPSCKSNNTVIAKILAECPTFIVGTADLTPSVNLTWPNSETFNPPSLTPISGNKGSYKGRYLHYGIREHAMEAIANGLAPFSLRTTIPITSTFFIFYLPAAPAVRIRALQKLHVIHVATHDSIGAGEDGPTHQPVELAALYRAMPNLEYMRPGDSEEVAGAWTPAINHTHHTTGPSIISVSRHAIPQLPGLACCAAVARGAYVLHDGADAAVTLIAAGAELGFPLAVARYLPERHNLAARVVSFPCHKLFREQPLSYQREVLRRHEDIPAVVIEPYVCLGWERYNYRYFGFTEESMAGRIIGFVGEFGEGKVRRGEFVEL
ncbi:hypothetical protein P171DRAFT_458856 [Karstenula rhodostoma CBS 690.94]|uniref:Transketolase-like pyrimidine-binding domain-containing protein n=1 Tax=Karstenula rhodostoma CBS 690.94 TaxID=1392251 RepID=A0A9P4U6Q1_9PLEO|nr:hypothetical protein P171DRAFT_458856 [Karstenula rhodostoma CBS 690.94]